MKILAIDTSCDDSCVAIVDTDPFSLLANVVVSHTDPMKGFGGIVPEIASREHLKALPLALQEALRQFGQDLTAIDWVCVTHRPGLIGALLVGVAYAKSLAFALEKPFSVINHLEGHLLSPYLAWTTGGHPPPHPWLALIASGGHTELFTVHADLSYHSLGHTLDDAAGEAFDKIGKLVGMQYPAGPQIDRWVRESATPADRKRFDLKPAQTPGYSFSFSGLKTAVSLILKTHDWAASDTLALLASAQEAIVQSLTHKIQLARAQHPNHSIVVTGGVACNSRLRGVLSEAYFPDPAFCTDNAAMIATAAALRLRGGRLEIAPWNVAAQAR